jgi:hypothetical protein
MPISSKKLNANIFTVGCRFTKSETAPEAASIISTAMTTAVAMTQNSLAIPTAVMTLSSENTIVESHDLHYDAAETGVDAVRLARQVVCFDPVMDLARPLV